MTDKVQKIREEVERIYNQSLADENRQVDRGLECVANVSYGKSKACKELLSFINSLQEEPVSEDERIRKAMIDFFKHEREEGVTVLHYGVRIECMIAWLEKQGEQKSTDKVEPKFEIEEGEWYICIRDLLDNYANRAFCKGYIYLSTQNGSLIPSNSNVLFKIVCPDTYFRHWTIQDAKAGDILCDYSEEYNNPLIFILKKFEHVDFGLVKPSDYSSYCFLTAGDRQMFKEGNYHHIHNIKPATIEQHDLLFQKMKEAGYEWDDEKKELKKIEQKPAWSEEDKCMLNNVIDTLKPLSQTTHSGYSINSMIDWLKDLKDRVQPSQEWSDEEIETCAREAEDNNCIILAKHIRQLKSLRPQSTWKPSEEQMRVLEWCKPLFADPNSKGILESLINDLKKLREE